MWNIEGPAIMTQDTSTRPAQPRDKHQKLWLKTKYGYRPKPKNWDSMMRQIRERLNKTSRKKQSEFTKDTLKEVMKALGLSKYIDWLDYIYNELLGHPPPPTLTTEQVNRVAPRMVIAQQSRTSTSVQEASSSSKEHNTTEAAAPPALSSLRLRKPKPPPRYNQTTLLAHCCKQEGWFAVSESFPELADRKRKETQNRLMYRTCVENGGEEGGWPIYWSL
jgi:hypothetical protein